MIELRYTSCCGVREISGLSNYNRKCRKALKDILFNSSYPTYSARRPGQFGMFLFTQASSEDVPPGGRAYGEQLKRCIERLKLGTVTMTGPFLNPNSGNFVRAYTWVVDWNRAMRFLQKELRKT